jgi:regulation of enolase protein 1 (concanavalin A-like superfamily)
MLVSASFAQDKTQKEIKGWGQVIDPDGDCTIILDKDKLMFQVPNSLHDLYPGQKDPKKRNNAPRVLQQVKGDFVATVKVTAAWLPGDKDATANTFPYNGAGLLVWESDNQFIRLERNIWVTPEGPVCYTTPLQYAQGRLVNMAKSSREEFYKGASTWLKITRGGETLTTSISHDGKEWIETAKLTTKLPDAVKVGVEAVNSSDEEFVVEFEEFEVTVKK